MPSKKQRTFNEQEQRLNAMQIIRFMCDNQLYKHFNAKALRINVMKNSERRMFLQKKKNIYSIANASEYMYSTIH